MTDEIKTQLGTFSKQKFNALINVRESALNELRFWLGQHKEYKEVTTSSLVNIAGSCENPNASFKVNYYGRDAHLSQSAQLQLEALVMRLRRWNGFYTVNNSFREEHFDDPEAAGRRLSEFTLIEAERPIELETDERNLRFLIQDQHSLIVNALTGILKNCANDIRYLGGNPDFLANVQQHGFPRISYSDAIDLIGLDFGQDLGIKEEREILKYFGSGPVFVTHHPANLKFFNAKRTRNGLAYSVDLLLPKLGEAIGGAIREEDGNKVRKQLRESKVGAYLSERGRDAEEVFGEYLAIFDSEPPIKRGGYGIGFERFVAFLIGSNDILETISYRTLQPTGGG